jgi:uncharacterized protein with NRDE domain
MCVIAIAYRASARYPLIVAANRDESHTRPTADAAWWPDRPEVLGGRDLEAGGTWLAVDRGGRLAAVTNLRDSGQPPAPGVRSRGGLVSGFLTGSENAAAFLARVEPQAAAYGPFNLLLYDGRELHYASNRTRSRALGAGVHAFSNAFPEEPWPKVVRAREGLQALLDSREPAEELFALLAEEGLEVDGADRRRASLFQRDRSWGTRCSTVVLLDRSGRLSFVERRFDSQGRWSGEDSFTFTPNRPA